MFEADENFAELDQLVQDLEDSAKYENAIIQLHEHVRLSLSSTYGVPKALKHLMRYYEKLKNIHQKLAEEKLKPLCSDVISALAVLVPKSESRDCLKYRLSGSMTAIGTWGHGYVQRLTSELIDEWNVNNPRYHDNLDSKKLFVLSDEILSYDMSHNSEVEACDLIMETNQLEVLDLFINQHNYHRACNYVTSCVPYVGEVDASYILYIACRVYTKNKQYCHALKVAMQLNDRTLMKEIFVDCTDYDIQHQMAFLLARQLFYLPNAVNNLYWDLIMENMENTRLGEFFVTTANELGTLAPKTPEDIYKNHPKSLPRSTPLQNLATSFVNAFVNCAYSEDILVLDDCPKWVSQYSGDAKISSLACIGLLMLWEVEDNLTKLEQFLSSIDSNIRAGALLAVGISSCGIQNRNNHAKKMLTANLVHCNNKVRICCIIGVASAYAGCNDQRTIQVLLSIWKNANSSPEVVGLVGLALGMISAGFNCRDTVIEVIRFLKHQDNVALLRPCFRSVALGLALCFIGDTDADEIMFRYLKRFPQPFQSLLFILVDICSYAGTGNVLKIQELLHICSGFKKFYIIDEDFDSEDEDEDEKEVKKEDKKENKMPEGLLMIADEAFMDSHEYVIRRVSNPDYVPEKAQDKPTPSYFTPYCEDTDSEDSTAPEDEPFRKKKKKIKKPEIDENCDTNFIKSVAVLGIAVIAMGEKISCDMAYRLFGHMVRKSEPSIRRAVPFALAMISLSDPKPKIVDYLSKLTHDQDAQVVNNAIFALGLVGAGTNNEKLNAILRELAQHYCRNDKILFTVRIAQGWLHLGKGLLTLYPYHCDGQVLDRVALSSLLCLIFTILNNESNITDKHYNLFWIVPAIRTKILLTLDEDMNPLRVMVRVGTMVETAAQVGDPKKITAFRTLSTPLILSYGEKAELVSDEYEALTPFLEGLVVLRKK